ncbi:PQQ-dependent sugar dehydrogenase [Qingshengfaniella alkalisoli]|uniref:PQQ-dependent sugar dehydrogenase n=1 Tax=Qingshengfaniella alkalisoli TaxID=2599296 RepID=A0A5B8I657_9RHOB|nr:PQQ-dependent sugar dehydrogenase [Qingshengfaniella alkalisoli]QDY68895.1 PQQ-dependent sugar dehydrogenase [Qingshengfaniella alkalisoli]
MSRPLLALLGCIALTLGPSACAQSGDPVQQGRPNVPEFAPAFPEQTRAPAVRSSYTLQTTAFATGLEHPWGIATLPDGQGFLVTERPGRMRHVGMDGRVSDPVTGLPEVFARGQGGLLDVAVGPNFVSDRRVYWGYAKPMGNGTSATAAARGVLNEDLSSLSQVEDIFVQQPPSPTSKHYGSRLVFDGAGQLFITTGEHSSASERVFAQDLDKSYGKVIRITPDGNVPNGNPFASREGALPQIWSYGHRNIQGATWHDGQLWTIEHGPKGGDELNISEAGRNFGWPVVSYGENYSGTPIGNGEPRAEMFEEPLYYWDPVIAPAGMTFYQGDAFSDWNGDLLISALNPGSLVRLELTNGRVTGEERLLTDIGRVRDIELLADGRFLLAIDAGRGSLQLVSPTN